MTTDQRFIGAAPSLQMVFRDKDTGLPLRSGVAKFFQDQSRTTPKNIFKLSGTPGAYTYTSIGNEIKLTGIGTFSDNGNPAADIIPFYFPYDLTPDTSTGTIEKYYVQVYSSGGVPQFTREDWPPNIAADDTSEDDLVNYVPNGQFLLHSYLPATDTKSEGEIRADVTDIAYGGWTFERPSGSTATDFVTFERFGSFVTNPTSSPRYAARIRCTDPGSGGDFKDLRVKWPDVNKFASADQDYTFYVSGLTNAGGSLSVTLYAIKNFGTGGSATEEKEIATFAFDNAYDRYKAAFVFGSNLNKTIGLLDDDYTQLALRFPTDEIFDTSVTDIGLTIGDKNISLFPITPNADFIYKSLAGGEAVPDYKGNDLYLPIILGPTGYKADRSVIGDVVAESALNTYTSGISTTTNRLLANGGKYERTAYSALGIPYQRLGDKYWIDSIKTPRYGTGSGYLTAVFSGTGNELRIDTNDAKAVTDAADVSTTFTISNIAKGGVWYTKAYLTNASDFYLENLNVGVAAVPVDVDTGFTFITIRTGSAVLKNLTSIATVAASALANPGMDGRSFHFNSYNAVTQPFYVWYKITNENDPAPGGRTGIQINLTATDTAAIVAQKTREALNGWQCTKILTVAASAVPASSYFTINSSTTSFYVWYKKDSVGTDPAIVGKTGIQVDILGTDTNTIVATKTQEAINRKYFAVPMYQGGFLRGWDDGAGVDPGAALRYSLVPGIIGDQIGTSQLDEILSHDHYLNHDNTPYSTGGSGPDPITALPGRTGFAGAEETRPINTYVNYAIIY